MRTLPACLLLALLVPGFPTAAAPRATRLQPHPSKAPEPSDPAAKQQALEAKCSFIMGNDPAEWHTDVPTFARMRDEALYPGLDAVYYGTSGQMEYDFVVAPGADPGLIGMRVEDADRVTVDEGGDLLLEIAGHTIRQKRPMLFQEGHRGERTLVPGGYATDGAGGVRFDVGSYDPTRPLVLSLYDEAGAVQPGFLRLGDVFAMRLGADLVVLSACETGLGKQLRGEGLVGLTRGFMYAGAPRVIVSLWSVNDRATADLMIGLYDGMLAKGMAPSAALRAAQIALYRQERSRAPFYWAPFVLQGDWR